MARSVRQGCPGSDFLFAMTFDPTFRWLQGRNYSKEPWTFYSRLSARVPTTSVMAASSLRCLMTALAPAFQTVDQTAGLNLNRRKCCWVQYGSERCESLLNWISDNL